MARRVQPSNVKQRRLKMLLGGWPFVGSTWKNQCRSFQLIMESITEGRWDGMDGKLEEVYRREGVRRQRPRLETEIDSGINGLNKDVQKLLWKSIMKPLKADLVLKSLGIMGPGKSKGKNVDEEEVE
uniref:Uncharacterized protein n=1 Tax=Salix viminalis TaxID=40686 RepID=A0A6N2NBG8_SALVM